MIRHAKNYVYMYRNSRENTKNRKEKVELTSEMKRFEIVIIVVLLEYQYDSVLF